VNARPTLLIATFSALLMSCSTARLRPGLNVLLPTAKIMAPAPLELRSVRLEVDCAPILGVANIPNGWDLTISSGGDVVIAVLDPPGNPQASGAAEVYDDYQPAVSLGAAGEICGGASIRVIARVLRDGMEYSRTFISDIPFSAAWKQQE
jgi:hypothetical protein